MSDIKFSCPGCSGHIAVDERAKGMQLKCPHCSRTILVPSVGYSKFSIASARSRHIAFWFLGGAALFTAVALMGTWFIRTIHEDVPTRVVDNTSSTNQSVRGSRAPAVRPLLNLAAGETRSFEGHTDPVGCVAVSPNGRYALSGCGGTACMLTQPERDHSIRCWDLMTGQETSRFLIHTDLLAGIAFTPDGRHVVSGSIDNSICEWDFATGKELHRIVGGEGSLCSLMILPDGKRVIAGYSEGAIVLWDLENSTVVRRFRGHEKHVLALAVSADGRRAVSGGEDRSVRFWDLENGREMLRYDDPSNEVFSVSISPDGRHVVSGSADGTVRLLSASTGTVVHEFKGHEGPVTCAAFSPDGSRFITCSGKEVFEYTQPFRGAATFRAQSVMIETGGGLAGWLPKGMTNEWEIKIGAIEIKGADGRVLETKGGIDNSIRLWDAKSGGEICRFDWHTKRVNQVVFSPDGRAVVSVSSDRTVRLTGLPKSGSRPSSRAASPRQEVRI